MPRNSSSWIPKLCRFSSQVFRFLLTNNLGSPTPQKLHILDSSNKENFTGNRDYSGDKHLQAELDQIELPRETIYMIDKVVRQRAKKGPFGVDNSELIADQHDREIMEKNDRIQRLVEGMSSHSRARGDEKDVETSSDLACRRINSVCARAISTMVPSSTKAIQMSNEKKMLEEMHSSIQSVRTITYEEWCRRKEMMQRLKDRLIEDAKLEILEQRKMKEMNDTKEIKNWEKFSKSLFNPNCAIRELVPS